MHPFLFLFSMSSLIEVSHLSKQFNEIKAVDDLSFSVQKGEVYGFLGQNGAGKSTTIRMLLTLIRPTGGTIMVFGKNLRQHRHEILGKTGAIIEKPDLYTYLTALQNLQMMATLSGIQVTKSELQKGLEAVGLEQRAHHKVKQFSQGMKQRLGIACALVHHPALIILDEPVNGLDPQGIADMRNLMLHLSRNEGKTLVVSSHLLSEMELIADSMLIIDKGRKVAEGRVNELLNPADTLVQLQTGNNNDAVQKLAASSWAGALYKSGNPILLRLHQKDIPALVQDLTKMDIAILALQPRHSLEDYFLSLTTLNQHVAPYQN